VRGAFGDYNAYFRNRNCVSVFDLESPADEDMQLHLSSCHPIGAIRPEDGGVFLFLGPTARGRLISWRKCGEERAYAEMVVPYVEAGHPGPISLADIEEVLEVEVVDYPEGLELMRKPGPAFPGGACEPSAEPDSAG
jgi:hypothetical protein